MKVLLVIVVTLFFLAAPSIAQQTCGGWADYTSYCTSDSICFGLPWCTCDGCCSSQNEKELDNCADTCSPTQRQSCVNTANAHYNHCWQSCTRQPWDYCTPGWDC